jgi:hypothetical protein
MIAFISSATGVRLRWDTTFLHFSVARCASILSPAVGQDTTFVAFYPRYFIDLPLHWQSSDLLMVYLLTIMRHWSEFGN